MPQIETTKGGVVKKAAKTQIQCTVCKGMFIESMPVILRDHGELTTSGGAHCGIMS